MSDLTKPFDPSGPPKLSGKLTMPLLVLLAICLFGRPAEAQYGGGTGEPDAPYLIYTAEQMNAIGAEPNDWNKHFILMADIDLSAYTGTDFNIIGYYVAWNDSKPFTGVFDGSGKKISNFSYISTGRNSIGFFGYVSGENAEIKDLGLIEPNIDAGTGGRVGSLVARNSGTITNCYAQGGSVSGNNDVGGLVGLNHGGTITNSSSSSSVSGNEDVGGLVGENTWFGTITNCYSSGTVAGTTDVGGLVGNNSGWYYDAIITNCYATGSVTATMWVGGLVGENSGTITNCYSTGSVSGNDYVGGLVGSNTGTGEWCQLWCWFGTISNCYSAASVTGDRDVGGLVGANNGGVSVSFWDIQTSGQKTSAGGTCKTTIEMHMASTFTGWGGCGNEGIWIIDEGNDYPSLWWEDKSGQVIEAILLSDLLLGTGTEPDPYLIYTAEELSVIGVFPCEWNKYFKLMADIDLSGFTGTDFNIIGNRVFPFTGVFDGSGHIISNFSYTSTGTSYVGLFGYVGGAEIKDLGLIYPDVDVGTGDYVGSLVGSVSSGTISKCYAEGGSVSGNAAVGGLVGDNDYHGTITNCTSSASVSGNWRVGGLVGENEGGTITNCNATGGVSGGRYVGGLVGYNYVATITNSYSTGSVTGSGSRWGGVGGLVGTNDGTIINCYASGSVMGTTNVGGLVGLGSATRVSDSFWDIETSGRTRSDGGTGLTTATIQMESTFTDAGWDFVDETTNGTEDIWWILEGQDYPRLTCELIEGGSTAFAQNRLAGLAP